MDDESERGRGGGDLEPQPDALPGFDMVAASIRADAADAETFFRVLVAKMSDALGDRVRVKRSGGLLKRDRPVTGVEMDLTNAGAGVVLSADREHNQITCTVVRRVRGIALSTKQVSMPEWIEELVSALADEAKRSQQTWSALHGLLS
ncbi:MAG TPA: hypothetical protein VN796_07035 [Acidimicrobiales bacterium]|nr:hypothetical protein [Acidimicrobiales bacterium]